MCVWFANGPVLVVPSSKYELVAENRDVRNEIGFSFSQPSCRPILHPPSKWEKALKKQVSIKLVFFALD